MVKQVLVERCVEQVQNGTRYKGYVKIKDVKLDYVLVFAVPIPEFDRMEPAKDADEVRRRILITVKRDNTDIDLTMEEYHFFFTMVVKFAVDFYNNPQTKHANEEFFGALLRGEGPFVAMGASASISITSSDWYDFPPQLCERLSAPKFGCALAV